MNEEEAMQMLIKSVPVNISNYVNDLYNELTDLRKYLIRKSRIITEFRYFIHMKNEDISNFSNSTPTSPSSGSNSSYTIGSVPEGYDKVVALFQPREVQTFIGLSMVSQNSSFLLNYLHENPALLVSCVLKSQKLPIFTHLTQCIIPSIFGYFASSEQMDYAHCFYLIVIDSAPASVAVPILIPFLSSQISYRFIEFALTNFFKKIAKRKLINTPEENMRNAKILIMCLRQAVPLLPEQLLQLFRQIKEKQWRLSELIELFFMKFIFPTINNWLKSSCCDHYINDFISIMQATCKLQKSLLNLFDKLCYTKSAFYVPQLFQKFDLPSIQYYLCIKDIQILVKLLENCKILPPFVDLTSFDKVPQQFQYISFWCSVYPTSDTTVSCNVNQDTLINRVNTAGRLVYPIYSHEKEENSEYKRQFGALHSLSKEKDPIKNIEFILANSGNDEFHEYAKHQCFHQLVKTADTFELAMEIKRLYLILKNWQSLLDAHEEKLILSHIGSIRTRRNVLKKLSITVQTAAHLNYIDEKDFEKHLQSLAAVGKDWDFLIHHTGVNKSCVLTRPSPPIIMERQSSEDNTDDDSNILCKSNPNSDSNLASRDKIEQSIGYKKTELVNTNGDNNNSINNSLKNKIGIFSPLKNSNHKRLSNPNIKSKNLNPIPTPAKEPAQLPNNKALTTNTDSISSNSNVSKTESSSVKTNFKSCSESNLPNMTDNHNQNVLNPMLSDKAKAQSVDSIGDILLANPDIIPSGFFETLELFSSIPKVGLYKRFLILQKAIEQIDFFAPEDKLNTALFSLFLKNIPGSILLPLYAELNVFAMREPEIFMNCSEQQRKRWIRFERMILKCATLDESILSRLVKHQNALQEDYHAWRGSNSKKFVF
ncbi:hypothetical protein TRFO_31982 [Tritrichomonas foetus]|uniref:Uncharacterized protein n=1 Tax=Tritrichomonas foetus TaxID=1144522 RepID=A0A1J4JQ03_9EUKA|nr:hypothetical protein TRFO_31982 [Tritrichomonas foetus]|eukprot:OHT01239.1 hypothetical protein TRFO_31982 [Tritrichomonas foetus]